MIPVVFLCALALAGPALAAPPRITEEPVLRIESVERDRVPTDEEITELLRDWSLFEHSMKELHATAPAKTPPPSLRAEPRDRRPANDVESQAEAAWVADGRVRDAFAANGSTPERFLWIYRRTSDAWFALQEIELRESTATAMERALASLEDVKDGGAEEARDGLTRGLEELRSSKDESLPGSDALDVIRRNRAKLARIFIDPPGSR